ncbi:MAG: DUF2802 domain-containing protein [Pseudomonadota bacterium]|jgi:Protein of unknown function (DUF2802).|nr:MAG: hypothetical protein DIU56_08430 [Pseudomonadota bacterium]
MTLPSVDLLLIAGRAVFLLFSFVLAAVAFTRWRRQAVNDARHFDERLDRIFERLTDVEQRIAALGTGVHELSGRLTEELRSATPLTPAPQSYEIAIRLARSGASREELMMNCGLTRQEADLVRRLHGPQRRESVVAA